MAATSSGVITRDRGEGVIDITLFQGLSISFSVEVGGTADISNYTAELLIKASNGSDDVIGRFSTDDNTVDIFPEERLINFNMKSAVSAQLLSGNHIYTIIVKDPDGFDEDGTTVFFKTGKFDIEEI